jgi:anti-sigma factor RsiW
MLNHLTFAKLADLAEGRLSSNEQEVSSAHLSTCSRCTAKLNNLKTVVGLMRTDRAEDAPDELVSRAINLFRSHAVASKEPSLVKRIVAALSFDSLQMSPAFGVRSGQASARQLLFVAGEYDLDLRITQSGETWNVSGQVFGEECVGGKIELEGETAIQADLNNQCEFTMAAIPAGSYQLRLRLPNLEVEIPQLELRA